MTYQQILLCLLDPLHKALHDRRPPPVLIHHSDHGSQYLSVRYTERLVDAGVEPSVGTVGDSYDNALAETPLLLILSTDQSVSVKAACVMEISVIGHTEQSILRK